MILVASHLPGRVPFPTLAHRLATAWARDGHRVLWIRSGNRPLARRDPAGRRGEAAPGGLAAALPWAEVRPFQWAPFGPSPASRIWADHPAWGLPGLDAALRHGGWREADVFLVQDPALAPVARMAEPRDVVVLPQGAAFRGWTGRPFWTDSVLDGALWLGMDEAEAATARAAGRDSRAFEDLVDEDDYRGDAPPAPEELDRVARPRVLVVAEPEAAAAWGVALAVRGLHAAWATVADTPSGGRGPDPGPGAEPPARVGDHARLVAWLRSVDGVVLDGVPPGAGEGGSPTPSALVAEVRQAGLSCVVSGSWRPWAGSTSGAVAASGPAEGAALLAADPQVHRPGHGGQRPGAPGSSLRQRRALLDDWLRDRAAKGERWPRT